MTDLHTHILPGMDDGARTPETSVKMLRSELEQGIHGIALTPHMYPHDESLDSFLRRRQSSFDVLCTAVEKEIPDGDISFYIGAELYWFNGIDNASGIEKLCIGESGLLLVEMPFDRWPRAYVDALLRMARRDEYRLVMAHIERYIDRQNPSVISDLLNSGVMFQCNAGFFTDRRARRGALHLLSGGAVHFLGSDAHNNGSLSRGASRRPNMGDALDVIRRDLGSEPLRRLADNAARFGFRIDQ